MADPSEFKMLESPAHRKLREQSNGIDLSQYSMLTAQQYQYLENEVADYQAPTILDIGCGIGRIAWSIANKTGCKAYGIDIIVDLIKEGKEAFAEKVEIKLGDYDSPPWHEPMFDVIYSVDSLYFSKDLCATIGKLNQLLKPNGKIILFWTELVDKESDLERLSPDKTTLAVALNKHGLKYEYKNYTEQEIEYWAKSKIAVEALKDEFIREGEQEYIERFTSEVEHISSYTKDNRVSRYCYTYKI